MSDKSKAVSGAGASAPNKMRLYATWVDRTPSNCIPRLCSLTLTRLIILKPLGSDLASLSIAVKMQSSKRTLRSHELILPQNSLLDTPLDITFCLQYPHFLKREGNKLHVLLQRRKRYKNRTMLGFKTLAEGVIRMDQVLQKHMDLELELVSDNNGKDKGQGPVAKLLVVQLSSTPVDQEQKTEHKYDFSDEEDEISSGEEEPGDLSDSEPIRTKLPHARRHNLKQRFVSLLRRFRVADSEGGRGADLSNPSDIQALFQELESLSCDEDSGGEQDTMSISSTPKPSLRPFFSSSRSLLDSSHHINNDPHTVGYEDRACSGSDGNTDFCYTDPEAHTDPPAGSPPREHASTTPRSKQFGDSDFQNLMQEISERKAKLFRSAASSAKKKNSLSVSSDVPLPEVITPRKAFSEQVLRTLPPEENILPESIILLNAPEHLSNGICSRISHHRLYQPISYIEAKTVLTQLFNKISKYCNSCAKPQSGTFVRIILVGGDTLVGWVVRPYVELLSSKPSEWLAFTRMYIVPVGTCSLARQMASLDQGFSNLFPPSASSSNVSSEQEVKLDDLVLRIQRYMSLPASAPILQLPVSEAMLTCHDDSSQLFIPFVNEVRVGPAEHNLSMSIELDDSSCISPPAPPSLTPPSSPNVQARDNPWEPLELQLDYWSLAKPISEVTPKTDRTKPDGKTSLKGLFRGLQATPTNIPSLNLNIHLANKEKKQKIMRLGKKKEKEKEVEHKSQCIESISRLICSARASHNTPMKVLVDGVEYNGVKFFQLSSTWQTHVKYIPIALVGVPLASHE